MMATLDFQSLSGRSCSITGFLWHQHTRHSMQTEWTIHSFYFSEQKGRIPFCPRLFLFFFSLLVAWNELASPGKMLWRCNNGSMAAIHLGMGHITGRSVGDQVRQVLPPSQQANLDVIICQDDVISKKYCCFWIPQGRLPINPHQT